MLVGFVAKPNVGKSTLFNALTMGHAEVASYPFTTIDPNKGVAFIRVKCACRDLGVQCKPRAGKCVDGEREVPVNVVDVAGLVEGAHEGKGRGNQFLNDLNQADALVCLADAAGATDDGGNPVSPGTHDPVEDVKMIERELDYWIAGVAKRNAVKARGKTFKEFAELLTGIRVNEETLKKCVNTAGLNEEFGKWVKEDFLKIAREIRKQTKPLVVAANKIDLPHAKEGVEKLRAAFPDYAVVPVAADSELALCKAKEKNWVEYDGKTLKVVGENLDPKVKAALESIQKNVFDRFGSTGVQELLHKIVFDVLGYIVVFPVEDEHHYADHFGNVLPDAVLLPKGSTAVDLAAAIHTDLAKHFLHAVDVKTKMRISKEHELKNGDVIKAVATK